MMTMDMMTVDFSVGGFPEEPGDEPEGDEPSHHREELRARLLRCRGNRKASGPRGEADQVRLMAWLLWKNTNGIHFHFVLPFFVLCLNCINWQFHRALQST